jgi:hypothetical protein
MEHVINAKLRNQAFWKFLVFFVITTAIIVIAVYFDTDLRSSENASLRTQIKIYEDQSFSEQQFLLKADSVKGLLDSLDNSVNNYDYYNTLIDQNLANMTSLANVFDSNNIYANLNKQYIIYSFMSLKDKHRQVKDASTRVKDLSSKLQNCEGQAGNVQALGKNNDF